MWQRLWNRIRCVSHDSIEERQDYFYDCPELGAKKKRAKVVYSYDPVNEDELQLSVGDVIDVVKQEEEGWWEGVLNGKQGVFPNNFVEIVEESENSDGGEKSTGPVYPSNSPPDEVARDTVRQLKTTAKPKNVRDRKWVYDDDGGDTYTKKDNQKGYVVIYNYSHNRKGTNYDVDALVRFFKNTVQFKVDVQHDLNKTRLEQHFEQVQSELDSKFYCFICIVLSHGDENGFETAKGERKCIEEISKTFANVPSFGGRPKLFFVQACRGHAEQEPMEIESDSSKVSDDTPRTIPRDADILIIHSNTPGYVSFRLPSEGSWFIQDLVGVFQEFHQSEHVKDMLTMVNQRVARRETSKYIKQMPSITSTLRKKLYLR